MVTLLGLNSMLKLIKIVQFCNITLLTDVFDRILERIDFKIIACQVYAAITFVCALAMERNFCFIECKIEFHLRVCNGHVCD